MINKVILAGRISSDVDLKTISDNLQISSFFLAVDRGKRKGAKESTVDFLRCKAFNRTAVNIHSYCKKGSLICITGQIHNNRYEKNGEMKYSTEIVAESIKFLPSLSGNSRDKSPDDTWDEFSFEEKLMVINDYNKRKSAKAENEEAPEQTQIQPIEHVSSQSKESVELSQRWSSELNKEEDRVPEEYKEKAEEIIQEFTGESSLKLKNNQNINIADSTQEEIMDTNATDDSKTTETEKSEDEITDKSTPF